MATKTGASGVVKVQVSGTTVAVVGEVCFFTFDGSADTIEDSVIGDTSRTYKGSLKTATLSMDVYWDDADAVQLVMDAAADLIFELYPTGTGTGEKSYVNVTLNTESGIASLAINDKAVFSDQTIFD